MKLFKLLKLFSGVGSSKKKWRSRALLVDLHKTKITIQYQAKREHLPPWMYKRLQLSIEDVRARSMAGKEYGAFPPDFPHSA